MCACRDGPHCHKHAWTHMLCCACTCVGSHMIAELIGNPRSGKRHFFEHMPTHSYSVAQLMFFLSTPHHTNSCSKQVDMHQHMHLMCETRPSQNAHATQWGTSSLVHENCCQGHVNCCLWKPFAICSALHSTLFCLCMHDTSFAQSKSQHPLQSGLS